MIRYATNPPRHQIPSSDFSPHLYHRPRPSSTAHTLHTPSLSTRLLTFISRVRARWTYLSTLLLLFWTALVYHSERHIWASSLRSCAWESWEHWPTGATPSRIALVADPQLVDIHTYSRRGLGMAATIFYSDLYLSRAWDSLHRELRPAETYFLGDLFDGGREWAPSSGAANDAPHDPREAQDWREKGMGYWLDEFRRFVKLFPTPAGVRVKAGLPGNHDLGFGGGVRENVRGRFEAFFGAGNDRWEVGNHTFVSIDVVSLSNEQDEKIYGPPREFLDSLSRGPTSAGKLPHMVETTASGPSPAAGSSSKHDLPTILLSHVPLYRPADTACGPRREKGTSIPIFRGYQYQNVLTPAISSELLKATGAKYVFSGDDHDACDVSHMYGTRGVVREWTVKAFSWNMGVRRPGFELVSLWNPLHDPAPEQLEGIGQAAHAAETPEQLTARLGPEEERDPKHEAPKPVVIHGGEETLQTRLC